MKILCRWFGHKWVYGLWFRSMRVDYCRRCGAENIYQAYADTKPPEEPHT